MSIQFTSKKVGELLKEGNLRIPSYQRPYKWNRKHSGTESIFVIFFMIYEMLWKKRNIKLALLSFMIMVDT